MAQEIHKFSVTTPAGTGSRQAPLLTHLEFPPRVVTAIEIVVPPGPRGVLGFAIGYGNNPVIPYEPRSYIVTDDEKITWEVHDQNTSGSWDCFTYNTGVNSHTVEIRFLCDLALPDAAPASTLLPAEALSSLAG